MALFTTAEARAFDKAQLADVSAYPTVDIDAKAAEIKEWLERICGVNFEPTSHDEWYDGDGSDYLMLVWPEVTAVTSITIDGVALPAANIDPDDFGSGLAIDRTKGIITLRGTTFDAGWSNVNVVYTAGFATVPALIKRAALMLCVNEMPASNAPWTADGYDAGGTSFSFTRGDGYQGNWSPIPDVMRAIRMYNYRPPAVA